MRGELEDVGLGSETQRAAAGDVDGTHAVLGTAERKVPTPTVKVIVAL